MNNFIFYNPTRLLFGKGMINQLTQQIPADKRIMITFGGGSVKTNGVYEQVTQALEGRDYTEFWGIEANPDIDTLKKAIAIGISGLTERLAAAMPDMNDRFFVMNGDSHKKAYCCHKHCRRNITDHAVSPGNSYLLRIFHLQIFIYVFAAP